ncbi:hypothetical protein [Ideonella livida]|uniref:YggT family protein n=1 Tax=Ideonella livida TaxID=2707176 RepID=A0A7C9PFU6_9BURK|nr:hypothetical protein [Ideonella livida]NDY90629.1 hypothetical protein [Ideonella livida]
MLWLAVVLKLWAEVACLAWVGRALLGCLVGRERAEYNLFWRLLDAAVAPLERLACRLAGGRAWPVWLWMGVLAAVWVAATALKVQQCRAQPAASLCRAAA